MMRRVILAVAVAVVIALACAGPHPGPGPGGGGDCVEPSFTPLDAGADAGEFVCPYVKLYGQNNAMGISYTAGGARTDFVPPIVSCGFDGGSYWIEASGTDHLLHHPSSATLSMGCGYRGAGQYVGSGSGLSLSLSSNPSVAREYVESPQTVCRLCIDPSGATGSFSCTGLQAKDGGPSADVLASTFVCAFFP
jgi:hypothetical protein